MVWTVLLHMTVLLVRIRRELSDISKRNKTNPGPTYLHS